MNTVRAIVSRFLRYPKEAVTLVPVANYEPCRSNIVGAAGFRLLSHGIRVSHRVSDERYFLEYTGRGCAYLLEKDVLDQALKGMWHNTTRIDIAIDLHTDISPARFVREHCAGSARTRCSIRSPTGETEYIGSMKSDRYCRVYRYADPHPRSEDLRIEIVFRRAHARVAAKYVAEGNLEGVAVAEGERLGIKHPAWNNNASEPRPVKALRRHSRTNAGTLIWLRTAVAPALARMLLEEEITWEEFNASVLDAMRGDVVE
jgi:DNA relaxase NicK